MGRPINKRYFGSGPGNQIKVRAKIGANAEGDGFIVRQKGTNKFIVTVGSNTGVCRIVNKDSGSLDNNEMIINVLTDTGEYVQATKLYNRVAIIEGNTKIKWNFAADLEDGSVQVLDVEGPTLVITKQPTNKTVVEGANTTFTVNVTGVPTAAISYQWEVDDGVSGWTTIAGATTKALSLTAVTLAENTYQYRVVITGTGAVNSPLTSAAATLTVTAAPAP
jgi:hypothetical protein